MTRVTVIMRTKNSAWILAQTLKALYSQRDVDFELLVMDSSSTDGTLEILESYAPRILSVEAGDYFPGKVLNTAMESCASDLVVFLNSDTVLLHDYALARLLGAFEDESVQAAFGRQVPRPEARPWVRRDYNVSFPAFGPAPDWMPLSLPVAAMRRSAWLKQSFYTDAWGSEDTQWGRAAMKRGWKIAYVPECVAMHSHNYKLSQLYGRRFIEGEADVIMGEEPISALAALARAAKRYVSDLRQAVADRALPDTPLRRLVEAWGYLRGARHGQLRKRRGDTDTRVGQQTVLKRYE